MTTRLGCAIAGCGWQADVESGQQYRQANEHYGTTHFTHRRSKDMSDGGAAQQAISAELDRLIAAAFEWPAVSESDPWANADALRIAQLENEVEKVKQTSIGRGLAMALCLIRGGGQTTPDAVNAVIADAAQRYQQGKAESALQSELGAQPIAEPAAPVPPTPPTPSAPLAPPAPPTATTPAPTAPAAPASYHYTVEDSGVPAAPAAPPAPPTPPAVPTPAPPAAPTPPAPAAPTPPSLPTPQAPTLPAPPAPQAPTLPAPTAPAPAVAPTPPIPAASAAPAAAPTSAPSAPLPQIEGLGEDDVQALIEALREGFDPDTLGGTFGLSSEQMAPVIAAAAVPAA